MEIVWLGHACFRIRAREATVVIDPCPPSSGYAIGKPTADIVVVTHDHENHNYVKAVAGKPTVIDSPGEYEIHGAFVTTVRTYHDAEKGEQLGKNMAVAIEMEGIKVVHLGDIGHAPSADQAEDLSGPDVLMIPVGGNTTIDGAKAAEVVALLEARYVLPMHYQTPAAKEKLDPPDRFLKEMQVANVEPQAKLSLTATQVPPDPQVVLLDYRG